jgi:hypothetical protein
MRFSIRALLVRHVFALLGLLAAAGLHAQAQNAGRNLNVIAVNTTSGQIYSVTFAPPGGSTTVGNTDESKFVRPEALAFVTNATTNQLDLLVADNQRGTIYRYPGALAPQMPPNPTTGTLVWNSQTSGTGPLAPDALAVDGYGNLFVANSTAGHSQSAQLWLFPVDTTAGSGSFLAPVLLDSNFQNKETLLEVTLVPTDVAGANGVSGGDLILLTTSRVLAYSQASGYKTHITLLSFPNGSPVPGGMDFWPFGNGAGANYSLLINSSLSGSISQYYFTNPLTAAPGTFYSGLSSPYRVKTLFQAGNPLLFVSENGAILELESNVNGTGTLLATVTQNVTNPQGLAVSNAFTNAASVCLQPGGCNLTGLLTHKPSGVSTLTGNIVENVCTVNADPRVSITSGVWACDVSYAPLNPHFTCPPGTPPRGTTPTNAPGCLPINDICPGFDDTGKMALPDYLCGKSGRSGAGFSLIKTLMTPTQFEGAYINNSLLLADGSDPLCGADAGADGAILWAPLQNEGTLAVYGGNMVDMSTGCGSGHSGTGHISVSGVGIAVNEAAPELMAGGLPRPLENFAQTKYAALTTTIDSLTQATPPNIAGNVSLLLWGGNVPPANTAAFGCLDQSWLDFYNATVVDLDGSPQWKADLQNAANLLTGADASGNTTCDGIVVSQLASNPSAFMQTPNATYPNAPIVLNPPGLVRSYWANLYYHLNTRILGNPPSTVWPLPVSVNVLPTAVTLASNTAPGSATLSWNTNGATGCALSSSDNTYQGLPLSAPQQPLTIPPGDAGTIVTYTVSCTGGPAATTVLAYVNVYPPPTISVSPSSVLGNSSATLSWNTNHAQGCMGNSNDPNATTFNNQRVNATGSLSVNPSGPGTFTYTLACTNTSTSVPATLTVLAAPTLTFTGGATTPMTALQGSGTTLYWNQKGNSGCTLSGTDGLSAALSVNPASGTTAVNTTVNPPATSPVTYTYTLACAGPPATPAQQITLTVVAQPTLQISNSSVIQGSSAKLSWNTFGNSTCSLGSSPPDTSLMVATPLPANSSATVTPTSAQTYTYTLTCPAPTTPVTATLTVNAPQPPTISVSPSSIIQGNSSTLSWTINTGDVCTGSSSGTDTNPADAFTGMRGVSGSMTVTPNATGTDTYSLNCTVPAVTQSGALTVTPQLAKISISIKPVYDLDTGDPGILAWSLSGGASGCVVSGSWPQYSVPQFSPFGVTSSGSTRVTWNTAGIYTYTLSCTNPSTPAQTSVTITRDR